MLSAGAWGPLGVGPAGRGHRAGVGAAGRGTGWAWDRLGVGPAGRGTGWASASTRYQYQSLKIPVPSARMPPSATKPVPTQKSHHVGPNISPAPPMRNPTTMMVTATHETGLPWCP